MIEAPAYARRRRMLSVFNRIQSMIESLFETHHVSYPEEAEVIEALIRMTERKAVLELGMHRGFCTLHMLRAVYPEGFVLSVDKERIHNAEMFEGLPFEFRRGDTVEVVNQLASEGRRFDFVYVDSDHSLTHTSAETTSLMMVTTPGSVFVYHDCPPMVAQGTEARFLVGHYLMRLVADGAFKGLILPTAERLDLPLIYGAGYDKRLRPHLGIFIRQ